MQGNGNLATATRTAATLPRFLDIEIDPPIEWNNSTYTTMHLEEPTARMIQRSEQEWGTEGMTPANMTKYKIALVSNASGLPRQVIDNLRISQLNEAYHFLTGFMSSGLPTGEN